MNENIWQYIGLRLVLPTKSSQFVRIKRCNCTKALSYGAPVGSLLKPQHTTRVLINWAKTHHHASESLLLTTCRAKLTFALVLHRHSRHWWLNFHDQSLMNTDGFFQETKEFEFPAKTIFSILQNFFGLFKISRLIWLENFRF